ncbi:hypothetical protein AB3X91_10265 [Paraburkholderia sp. BR14263]|uniref:hypothetical protein n=1 Tax=unclassified Paraburkholderia TaxID=2615204 RepID=UPI0034CD5974
MAAETGRLHVPGTLYLNEKYGNPHTQQVVARALRVWVRPADAFGIDLAARALEGHCREEEHRECVNRIILEVALTSYMRIYRSVDACKGHSGFYPRIGSQSRLIFRITISQPTT